MRNQTIDSLVVYLRGGGDLASGVALRLYRAGARVIISELAQPLTVRRGVAFSQAVYDGQVEVEGVRAERTANFDEAIRCLQRGVIPVLVDPDAAALAQFDPQVLVDGRMLKLPPEKNFPSVSLTIGLGPGFIAGENCDAVIETMRGPFLGRVFWNGPAAPDSGRPDRVGSHESDRVLRAPASGVLDVLTRIGDHLDEGQVIARVNGVDLPAPFSGRLRGIMMSGLRVDAGIKIGDLDPRDDERLCWLVSDKALAIGGGVLEAVLSKADLRARLCV